MPALHDIITKGSTDRSVVVHIMDSTDGTPETGVVFNTSGIDLWYRREGAARVAVTEATLAALTTAHADGGFLHVSDGDYRLDLPDAAFATGANYVDFGGTVTGMIVVGGRVRLVDYSLEVNWSTNAAAGASGGLLISGSNAGTTTLGALTITGATTHTGATVHTGAVTMAAGIAITQSQSNVAGLSVTGNGTGHGIIATSGSGATGDGIRGTAASTNGNGINGVGVGTGAGVLATGGATGHGISGVGGATSGNGIRATGTAGNSAAMNLIGQGSAAGLLSTGGATGQGVSMVGGATSGLGLGISYTAPIGPCAELGIAESGTLQSATATTAVLRSATAFADDLVIGMTLAITGGTGAGQSRLITDWVSSTDTATVETWTTTPDNTSTYEVYRTAASSGGSGLDAAGVRAALGMSSANLDTQLSTIDTVVDSILVDTGTTLDARIPAALVSGRMDCSVGAMAANVITAAATAADFTTEVTNGLATAAGVTSATSGLATAANLATVAGYLDTEIAAILADTNELQIDWANGGRLDVILDARASQTSVDTIDDLLDTEIAAIKSDTAAILLDTGTDGVVVATASKTGYALSAAGVDAIWDEPQSGHVTAGTFGVYIDSAISGVSTGGVSAGEIADAVWDEALSGHATGGSAGAALSTAAAGGGLDAAGVRAAIGLASANLDTQLGAIDTTVDAILVDTAEIGSAGAGLTALASQASVNTIDDLLDTEVAAIKAKTDQLTFTVTGQVDANAESINAAAVLGNGTSGNKWRGA